MGDAGIVDPWWQRSGTSGVTGLGHVIGCARALAESSRSGVDWQVIRMSLIVRVAGYSFLGSYICGKKRQLKTKIVCDRIMLSVDVGLDRYIYIERERQKNTYINREKIK